MNEFYHDAAWLLIIAALLFSIYAFASWRRQYESRPVKRRQPR